MIGEDYRVSTAYDLRVPMRDSTGALQTGESVAVAVYGPDESAATPPTATEIGTTGVYNIPFTFGGSEGAYTFLCSASGCLTTVFTVQARAVSRGDLAPASTAISNATWTDVRAGYLDAAISSRSSHAAADVWAVTTRTLTSFGTLVADAASAVWGAVTRTLTSGAAPSAADIADAVWDEAAEDHETEGTTGAALASAAEVGGAGLSAQEVRDAMKLAPSSGSPAVGSVDYHLDEILSEAMLTDIAERVQAELAEAGVALTDGAAAAIVAAVGGIVLDVPSYALTARAERGSPDIVRTYGETAPLTLTLTSGGVALDLSDATVELAVAESLDEDGETALATWSTEGGTIAVSDPTNGVLAVSFASDVADALTPGTRYYTLEATLADGMRSFVGQCIIRKAVHPITVPEEE